MKDSKYKYMEWLVDNDPDFAFEYACVGGVALYEKYDIPTLQQRCLVRHRQLGLPIQGAVGVMGTPGCRGGQGTLHPLTGVRGPRGPEGPPTSFVRYHSIPKGEI